MSNVQIRDMYDAFSRGDVPAVLAVFDSRMEWREAEGSPFQPSGESWVGGDAIIQNLFVKLGEEWDGFTVTPTAFHDAGDTVIVEGRYKGTYKPTGKSLDAQVCHVWTARDGKIMSYQQYTDTAQMQDVMGAR